MNLTSDFLFGRDPIPMDAKTITIPLRTYEALLRKVEELERQQFIQSWKDNPDRMGQ
jgi:hypothetical protein